MQTNKKGLKKNSTNAPKKIETKSSKKPVVKAAKKSAPTASKKEEAKVSRKVANKTTKKPETKVSKSVAKKTTKKPDTKSLTKAASTTAKKPETKVSKSVAKKTTKKPDTKSSKKVVKKVPKKTVKKQTEDGNKRVAKLVTSGVSLLLFLVIYVVLINRPITNEVKYDSAQPEVVIEEIKKEEINITISPDVDLNAERKKYKNDDIVARLEIPDLFNILVVKGNNNSYYLNRAVTRKKDNRGTEFMDYRVNPDSKQINIYGHNSRTYDIPFRKLEKFLDKDFFEENKYIVLQTDSGRRIYKIFSIKEYAKDYEYMVVDLTGKDFVNHLNILKKDSINSREVEYDENSNLLVLQTCSYGKKNTYYIISAIEIEE